MESVSAVLPETATFGELSFRYTDVALQAPISKGEKVSSVQVWHGNVCVAQTDLFAMNNVSMAGSIHSVEQDRENALSVGVVGWIFFGAVLAAVISFGAFYLIKHIRVLSDRKRIKRYRRSRRRSR